MEGDDVVVRKCGFLSFGRRTTRGGRFLLLLGVPQEVAKKGTKGPNTLWKPAVRKGRGAVALLIFSQKQTASTLAFAS